MNSISTWQEMEDVFGVHYRDTGTKKHKAYDFSSRNKRDPIDLQNHLVIELPERLKKTANVPPESEPSLKDVNKLTANDNEAQLVDIPLSQTTDIIMSSTRIEAPLSEDDTSNAFNKIRLSPIKVHSSKTLQTIKENLTETLQSDLGNETVTSNFLENINSEGKVNQENIGAIKENINSAISHVPMSSEVVTNKSTNTEHAGHINENRGIISDVCNESKITITPKPEDTTNNCHTDKTRNNAISDVMSDSENEVTTKSLYTEKPSYITESQIDARFDVLSESENKDILKSSTTENADHVNEPKSTTGNELNIESVDTKNALHLNENEEEAVDVTSLAEVTLKSVINEGHDRHSMEITNGAISDITSEFGDETQRNTEHNCRDATINPSIRKSGMVSEEDVSYSETIAVTTLQTTFVEKINQVLEVGPVNLPTTSHSFEPDNDVDQREVKEILEEAGAYLNKHKTKRPPKSKRQNIKQNVDVGERKAKLNCRASPYKVQPPNMKKKSGGSYSFTYLSQIADHLATWLHALETEQKS